MIWTGILLGLMRMRLRFRHCPLLALRRAHIGLSAMQMAQQRNGSTYYCLAAQQELWTCATVCCSSCAARQGCNSGTHLVSSATGGARARKLQSTQVTRSLWQRTRPAQAVVCPQRCSIAGAAHLCRARAWCPGLRAPGFRRQPKLAYSGPFLLDAAQDRNRRREKARTWRAAGKRRLRRL
jgi:hypothetical protein